MMDCFPNCYLQRVSLVPFVHSIRTFWKNLHVVEPLVCHPVFF
ncbi:hypothetical protein BH24CHL4_BH24CHL4_03320 [soil metagenome]